MSSPILASPEAHDWQWRMDAKPIRWHYSRNLEGLLMFAADVRQLLRSDDDCLILFSGEPGRGKSTFMLQLLKLIDPEGFGLERIHFTIEEFMSAAPFTPKCGSIAADEFLASRRKAMRKEMIELNDFFQYCRQWNLAMGICFPAEHRMDLPILEDRVRFKVDCPKRGLVKLYQRVVKTVRVNGRVKRYVDWIERGRWTVAKNSGTFWEGYMLKKNRHFQQRGIRTDVQPEEIKADAAVADPEDLGFDPDALERALRELANSKNQANGKL